MDIKVVKRPFPRGGVSWSTANRWIVGTSAQVLIATPQFTVAGRIPAKREVIAAIEPTQNIEAVGLLDGLPGSFPYADAIVVLASDSTIRVFASSQNPDSANWKEVGRGGFGTGAEHICAIASTTLAGADGTDELPVVACGSMGGQVSAVGLGGYSDGRIEASRVLTFDAHASAISYLVWLHDSVTGEGAHRRILAVCAADGVVQLWGVAPDLSEAALVMVACERDWRPVTAHGVGTDCCVLAKQGLAMVIDARDARSIAIHRVALGGSQTLVACAVDDGRGRIYIGSYDFVIAVLARRGDEWCRAAEEEAPLRDGMRKTVVQSFTTKFNMQRLFLRGLALSPQGRYLGFAVDDQVNWDMVIDGAAITRIHFHQLGGWTTDDAKRALERVLDGKCPGALRYSLWDIVNGESTATIGTIVDHLRGMDLAPGSAMHRQRLHILNVLSCALEVSLPGRQRQHAGSGGGVPMRCHMQLIRG
ncbi:hypothetical protein LPJ61_005954 [Coemansia biformis]|uniref:WD40 repeat-like protein n=1 Tax=Coemansia biformis TaxID=1286918 RepID=A0A9W8CS25_9FUNG|nr:hypothetical protein LPJ61_005954 [Coemansia biformis]